MKNTWVSLIQLWALIAGVAASQSLDVQSDPNFLKCLDWCLENKLGLFDCIVPAKLSTGPCFVCGPSKTNPFEQLCGGHCVNTATDAQNCGGCGNKCTSGTCCAGSCSSNAGLEWAYYENPYVFESYYPAFDPTGVKNMTPVYNSTTTYVGLYAPGLSTPISIYGSEQTFSELDFILDHRGYLYAQKSGVYTVTTTADDDILLVWLGPLAYSGFDRANANMESAFPTQDSKSFTMNLVQGKYYPLRIMFANTVGAAIENITITDPEGTVILGANTGASPWIVQYSCDGTTAPRYPDFGHET